MIKAVLFDLDATLLPMDQDAFIENYFKLLTAKIAPLGYDPKTLVNGMWLAVNAMIKNDGKKTNEEVFWGNFVKVVGEKVLSHKGAFEEFYETDFLKLKAFCSFNPDAAKTVRALKERGIRVILATNPLYPTVATNTRIEWAGLNADDFELITTYENSRFSKPFTAYYAEILDKIGVKPDQALMVGNDVDDDMPAEKLGMKVFLLTDCLINKDGRDISRYKNGNFEDLANYISTLI